MYGKNKSVVVMFYTWRIIYAHGITHCFDHLRKEKITTDTQLAIERESISLRIGRKQKNRTASLDRRIDKKKIYDCWTRLARNITLLKILSYRRVHFSEC